MLATDGYKLDHRRQYPKKTQYVYSNFTPRGSRIPEVKQVIFFGLQPALIDLTVAFDQWFATPIESIIAETKLIIESYLGPGAIGGDYSHIEALHKLGYLPIEIRARKEGDRVNLRTPMFTIENTHPDFFWVTNFLETLISASIWQPCTSATIADQYRTILDRYAKETGSDPLFVPWQGHDFSFRGMSSVNSAIVSSAGHLLSFTGTDTVPVLEWLHTYYEAPYSSLIGGSVAATEHSVMSAGGREDEFETYRRLIEDLYPEGIVSIVSDTWDLWNTLTNILPRLKDSIMARNGKVVIRPDSGNPADIVCGNPNAPKGTPEHKGVIELLYEVFGGTTTVTGHIMLDPHVGAIYGDSITVDRCEEICRRLAEKGFASGNMVYGIGSFTYQYVTRDTFGFALKATNAVIDGVETPITKDPITDSGLKKSARGLLRVVDNVLYDNQTRQQMCTGDLKLIYRNGNLIKSYTLDEVRANVAAGRNV